MLCDLFESAEGNTTLVGGTVVDHFLLIVDVLMLPRFSQSKTSQNDHGKSPC